MKGSRAFSLGSADWASLLRSFLLALAGFVLYWVGTTFVPFLQGLDTAWAGALATALPVVVNILRKWVPDTTKQ